MQLKQASSSGPKGLLVLIIKWYCTIESTSIRVFRSSNGPKGFWYGDGLLLSLIPLRARFSAERKRFSSSESDAKSSLSYSRTVLKPSGDFSAIMINLFLLFIFSIRPDRILTAV